MGWLVQSQSLPGLELGPPRAEQFHWNTTSMETLATLQWTHETTLYLRACVHIHFCTNIHGQLPPSNTFFLVLMRSKYEFRKQISFHNFRARCTCSWGHDFQMNMLIKFWKSFPITKWFYRLILWLLLDIAPQLGRIQYTTYKVKIWCIF